MLRGRRSGAGRRICRRQADEGQRERSGRCSDEFHVVSLRVVGIIVTSTARAEAALFVMKTYA
jgi:hypothetical protein